MTANQSASQNPTAIKSEFDILENLYVKNVSLQAFMFPQNQPIQTDLTIDIASIKLEHRLYELTLSITVTVRYNEKTALIVEVQQSGIFNLQAFNETSLHSILGINCPSILFPYVRELASTLIADSGFPQIYLALPNFDALYKHEMQKQSPAVGEVL